MCRPRATRLRVSCPVPQPISSTRSPADQAARRAGTVDELVRIGRPVAVVFDGNRVEGRAVASVVAIVTHGRRNLASPADGTAVRSPSFEVGGDGKPVGIRRGPATVIGDVGRFATPLVDAGSTGKARPVGPRARRPASDRKANSPRGKGWPSMHRKTVIALLGAIVMAVAGSGVALASTSPPSVTVQVKNGTKTLTNSVVHGEKGWVTKGGTPKGKCPGSSAAGALDAATHGKWTGKYYAGLGGICRHLDRRGEAEGQGLLGALRERQVRRAWACARSSCTPVRRCCSRSRSTSRLPAPPSR